MRIGCSRPWKLHTCFSREPATPTRHSHTHHCSWFSVTTNFYWARHCISPFQLREWVSLLVKHLCSSEIWSYWSAVKIHETYLSSNEQSKGRKAILHPAACQEVEQIVPRCMENARVSNHCKHIGCYAHSLENYSPGAGEGYTHPFKICGWKVLWCLISGLTAVKICPWGTLLGDFLKKDLLWAGDSQSGLELEDTNRNRLQETKAVEICFRETYDTEKPVLFSFVLVTGKLYQSHLGQLDPPWPASLDTSTSWRRDAMQQQEVLNHMFSQ